MKNIVVIYQSKYGSTKKYASWLAEELSCDIFERKQIKPSELAKYDVIIYGGGLYAGGISGVDLITNSYNYIKDKKIIIFSCGVSDPTNEENINNIRRVLYTKFTPEMKDNIKVFHLRGGIDYTKLNFMHKTMMSMLVKMVKKKDREELNAEQKEMIDTYGQVVDFTDKQSLQPIIEYIKNI